MTDTLLRASLQSGVALLVIAVLCRLFSRLSANTRCWLWRLGYLKCLVALVFSVEIGVPILSADLNPTAFEAVAAVGEFAPTLNETVTTVSGGVPTLRSVSPELSPIETESIGVAPEPEGVNGLARIVMAYLLVSLVVLVHSLLSALQTVRFLRRASVCSHPALASLLQRFRLRQAPRLARLSGFTSPLLAFNTILLPEPALAGEHMILAHELAHVKRRDLFWEAIGALVQVIFWFHPLVWYARREERLAREQAADALALTMTNAPRAEYARILLTTTLRQTPALAVGAFASPSRLRRRLEALAQPALSRRKALGFLTLVGILVLPALVPWKAVARKIEPVAIVRPPLPTRIRGRVVNTEGVPLEGAIVTELETGQHFVTNKDGSFKGPGGLGIYKLRAVAPGYAESAANTYDGQLGWLITLQHTVCWKAEFLGNDGQPIRNLPVRLGASNVRGKTNAQGRYSVDGIVLNGAYSTAGPSPFKVLDPQWAIASTQRTVSPTALRERIVLVPASTLQGGICDQMGKPIAQCDVILQPITIKQDNTTRQNYNTLTDSAGNYQFTQIPPGDYQVYARAHRLPLAPYKSSGFVLRPSEKRTMPLTLTPGVTVRGALIGWQSGPSHPNTFPLIADRVQEREEVASGQFFQRELIGESEFLIIDAHGQYELHLTPGTKYLIHPSGTSAVPPIFGRLGDCFRLVEGKEGAVIEANFHLEPSGQMSGKRQ